MQLINDFMYLFDAVANGTDNDRRELDEATRNDLAKAEPSPAPEASDQETGNGGRNDGTGSGNGNDGKENENGNGGKGNDETGKGDDKTGTENG